MNKETVDILVHLVVAMVAGGLIGLERSYYGRPAGLRTHPGLHGFKYPDACDHISARMVFRGHD